MDEIATCKEILKFASEIIGKDGGIKLDTKILYHNGVDMDKHDVVVIGTSGVPIVMQDIINTFTKIENDPKFEEALDSGRSYFFEGYSKDGAGKYSLFWGS